jgi:hypothetical protein
MIPKFIKQYKEKLAVYFVNGVHAPSEAFIESYEITEKLERYKIKYKIKVNYGNNEEITTDTNDLVDVSDLYETENEANIGLNNNVKYKCDSCKLLIKKDFDDIDDFYCALCIHYQRNAKNIREEFKNGVFCELDKNGNMVPAKIIQRIGETVYYNVGKRKSALITIINNNKRIIYK